MNVVTVAFFCSIVIVLVTVSDEVHCVDGKRTAALSTVKGDEPTLTAGVTASRPSRGYLEKQHVERFCPSC